MRRIPKPSALAVLSLACIVWLAACSSSSTPVLQYVTITPSTATTSVGGTQQFKAQAYYSNGSVQDGTALVSWASSNTSVATIVAGGLATGVGIGTTTITASAAGTPGATATLTVNKLTSITVTPANPTVPLGTNQQFKATASFSDGTSGDITSTASWTSSNTAAATMDTTTIGQADVPTTATAGTTSMITATQFSVSGSTTLTVGGATTLSLVVTPASPNIAVGQSVTFTAMEKLSDGTTRAPSSTVTWASDTTSVANIAANGVAAAFAAGTANITAAETGLTPAPTPGTAKLTVVAGVAKYAYVSNTSVPPNSNIQSYSVSTSTSPYLTPTTQSTFTPGAGTFAQPLIDPSGLFMYYTDSSGAVQVAAIDPTSGALSNLSPAPTAPSIGSPNLTVYMVEDPYGRFLYIANNGANAVYGFLINADHSLTGITGMSGSSPLTTSAGPTALFIDHTGSYLYVVTSDGFVNAFNIDQTTGAATAFTSNPKIATGSGPVYGTLDPTGTYLYIANGTDDTVSEYSIGSGGVLTNIGTLPASAMPGVSTSGIVNVTIDPSGTHAYVLDSGPSPGTGQIFGFSIGTGGVINASAPVSATIPATGQGPLSNIAIDPTGTLLVTPNNLDGPPGTISMFLIGTGGVLTPTTPATVNAESAPLWIIFYNAAQ